MTSSGEPLDSPHLRCITILHMPTIISHLPELILTLDLDIMVERNGLCEHGSSGFKVTLIDRNFCNSTLYCQFKADWLEPSRIFLTSFIAVNIAPFHLWY